MLATVVVYNKDFCLVSGAGAVARDVRSREP